VDIVHIHHSTQISLSPILAAKLLHKPVIFSFYDYYPLCPKCNLIDNKKCICTKKDACDECVSVDNIKNETIKSLLKSTKLLKIIYKVRTYIMNYLLSNVNSFIVLSDTWKRLLIAYGIPESKISVVPLPVTVIHPEPTFTAKHPSLLFVGWESPHKGLDVLVNALSSVKSEFPDVMLYVISADVNPEYHAQVMGTITKYGLENNVTFLGKSTYTEIHSLLDQVDVVVVPEQWNIAWSIFLTEAMAHGKPIVASYIGDIPDVISHCQTGYLVSASVPMDFAEGITKCLKNPEFAKTMGEKAKVKIESVANDLSVLTKVKYLYRKVLVDKQ
jgi:glycosyltransferase involved in cell wall biosynthesis